MRASAKDGIAEEIRRGFAKQQQRLQVLVPTVPAVEEAKIRNYPVAIGVASEAPSASA